MKKPTLVLIPGLLSDNSIWKHQIATLQPYANMIIPDMNQFNEADAFIENLLTLCPKQFYLAGHSMGGWLAIELMRKHSDRVRKLCILATSASLDSERKMRLRNECINLVSTATTDEIVKFLAGFYAYKPEIVPTIIDMFKRNIGALVSQQQAMMKRRCCKDLLPSIDVPTTVIVGAQDKEFFSSTTYIADHIPGASLVILNNCGHMLLLEQPEKCSELLLEWLLEERG